MSRNPLMVSGNLINHLILRKLHGIMLIPAVSLMMSWQALCPLLPTTVTNLALTVMCHTWNLESPDLLSASDFLSSLYGKHRRLEHLTLRVPYKSNYSGRSQEKGQGKELLLCETLLFFQYKFVSVSFLKLCSRHSISILNSCTTVQQTPKSCSSFNLFLELMFHFVRTSMFSHVFLGLNLQ